MGNEQEIRREIQLLNLQKTRLKNIKTIISLEDDSVDKADRLLKVNRLLRRNYSDLIRVKSNIKIVDEDTLKILTDHKKQISELLNLNNTLNSDLSKQLKIRDTITNIDKIQSIGAHLINVSTGKNRDIRLEIQDIGQNMVDNQKSIIENESDNLDISKQLLGVDKLRQKIQDTYGNTNELLVEQLLKELKTREDILQSQQLEVEILARRNELIEAGVGQIESVFDSITSSLESLPGGGMLSKVLGIESFGKEFTKTIKDNLDKGQSAFTGLGSTISKSFGVIGKALTSTLGSVLGLAAIFGILYSVLSGITEKIIETTKELGISTDQSKKLVDNSKEWVGQLAGGLARTEDILSAQSDIVKEYGSTNNISKELVDNIITMDKAFGVSGETIAKVTKSLSGLGIGQDAIATANILAGGLAEAAGVPIGEVMADVAQSSEMIHKYISKTPQAIYRAAIEAKRLGLTLEDIGKVGDKLINIQSSLESEMTAQVLLGKKIDFDRSRELFANKKPLEAITVLMEGIGDINKANMFQQQAITEATGLTVDQIAEYQRKQKEIIALGPAERARYKAAEDSLAKLNKDQEKNIVQQAEANLQTEEMKVQWDAIKQSLIKALQPLAEALIPILKVASGLIAGIAKQAWLIKGIFIALGTIWTLKLLKPILGTISSLGRFGDLAKGIFSKFGKGTAGAGPTVGGAPKMPTTEAASKPSKIMQGLAKIDWKKMLAGAAAMVLVAAAVWIMAKAMQEFSTGVSWEGVLMGIVSLVALTAAVFALGLLMMSGVGTIAIIAGAAAMVILAGGMWILGKAMQEFSTAAVMIIPFFEAMFSGFKTLAGLGPGLLVAAAGIAAVAGAMALFAGGSILGAIGSIFTEVGIVRTLAKLSNLAPGLNSVAESLNQIKVSLDSLNGTKADIGVNVNKAETIGTEGQKITPFIPAVALAPTGPPEGLSRIASLIEKLIMSVNQPQAIYIGNKVINEITRQQKLSRHLAIGVDNSYGYTI